MHIIERRNELIERLFVEAGGIFQYTHDVLEADYSNFNFEKFADLIIKEYSTVTHYYE